MQISLRSASIFLGIRKEDFYIQKKYSIFVKKSMFDIDAYNLSEKNRHKENDFKYDMLNFCDFLIIELGKKAFYGKLEKKDRGSVSVAIKTTTISLKRANNIKDIFYDEYYQKYLNSEFIKG